MQSYFHRDIAGYPFRKEWVEKLEGLEQMLGVKIHVVYGNMRQIDRESTHVKALKIPEHEVVIFDFGTSGAARAERTNGYLGDSYYGSDAKGGDGRYSCIRLHQNSHRVRPQVKVEGTETFTVNMSSGMQTTWLDYIPQGNTIWTRFALGNFRDAEIIDFMFPQEFLQEAIFLEGDTEQTKLAELFQKEADARTQNRLRHLFREFHQGKLRTVEREITDAVAEANRLSDLLATQEDLVRRKNLERDILEKSVERDDEDLYGEIVKLMQSETFTNYELRPGASRTVYGSFAVTTRPLYLYTANRRVRALIGPIEIRMHLGQRMEFTFHPPSHEPQMNRIHPYIDGGSGHMHTCGYNSTPSRLARQGLLTAAFEQAVMMVESYSGNDDHPTSYPATEWATYCKGPNEFRHKDGNYYAKGKEPKEEARTSTQVATDAGLGDLVKDEQKAEVEA